MRVSLVGAELEENLGLRYMASSLEAEGHQTDIVPFNSRAGIPDAVRRVIEFQPEIAGLSMVFTIRGREFCDLAKALRQAGYDSHLVAGGPFASFNCERLLREHPAFDSIALGEGEELICSLARNLDDPSLVPGLCYRNGNGSIATTAPTGNPQELDPLPFPKRDRFHTYLDRPIASVLTSRGCWRDCAFCSINAWYQRSGGGKKFRVRSVNNLVAELERLYFDHGVRIFNFQDDNFFLPHREKAATRFASLRDALERKGATGIAIAVKARPDSITRESVAILDDLGIFRVFLGVENAAENGLKNLNRKCDLRQILDALEILNDYDTHIAFNLLMFEPDTTMEDLRVNLRFLERHTDNPCNFCRAEAHAGTGLESRLQEEDLLRGDYFGLDYRIKDPRVQAFHEIANYAFFDRNFSDNGLHYFNMQVDFYFQLLRRFHPELLTMGLRSAVRNFIKRTNLDTYECLCEIHDFVSATDPGDNREIERFAARLRSEVDSRGAELQSAGERILHALNDSYLFRNEPGRRHSERLRPLEGPISRSAPPRQPLTAFAASSGGRSADHGPLGPVPYTEFKQWLAEQQGGDSRSATPHS